MSYSVISGLVGCQFGNVYRLYSISEFFFQYIFSVAEI